MKRAITYTQVSTHEQKNNSPSAQRTDGLGGISDVTSS
jgi:hypothetical protein